MTIHVTLVAFLVLTADLPVAVRGGDVAGASAATASRVERVDFAQDIVPRLDRFGGNTTRCQGTLRAVFVNPDQDEARLTVSAPRFAPVGVLQNLIINGSIRTTGRQSSNAVAPAIAVKIVPPAAPAAAFNPGPSWPWLTPERPSVPAVARRTPTKPARGGVGNSQQTVLLDVLAPYAG